MEPRDLQYFAVVAEHGNLRRAADAIGISQPALSKTLRRLEKSSGAKVVKRTPKGVELTIMGMALLGHGKRLRLAMDDVLKEVADLNGGRTGILRLGASFEAAELLLPNSCEILYRRTPEVTVKITVASNEALIPALRRGELDLIISGIPKSPDKTFAHEHIWDEEFLVCASASHPLARRKRVTIADLADERWALASATTLSWQKIYQAFADNGLPPPHVAMEANFRLIRMRVISQSGMLGFVPRWELQHATQRAKLVEIPVKELTWIRQLGVRYRREAYLSPVARRFIDVLKSEATRLREHG
jgi:DNA-binding transcriptional LysR family regulator